MEVIDEIQIMVFTEGEAVGSLTISNPKRVKQFLLSIIPRIREPLIRRYFRLLVSELSHPIEGDSSKGQVVAWCRITISEESIYFNFSNNFSTMLGRVKNLTERHKILVQLTKDKPFEVMLDGIRSSSH